MEINVRLYKEADLPEMVRIWNEIIETGIYFDYDEILTVTLSAPGLQSRLLPLWLKMKMATSTACRTEFIRPRRCLFIYQPIRISEKTPAKRVLYGWAEL